MRAGPWGIVMMMIDDAVGGAMNRVGGRRGHRRSGGVLGMR
jgi:hypothetical protein